MTRLEKLQEELRGILGKLKEFRDMAADKVTDERRASNKADLERAKALEIEIRDLIEAEALETRLAAGGDAHRDDNGRIEVPDQPIYRGSPANALGQQALDIYLSGANVSRSERDAAIDRLEQNTKRCLTLMEKRGEVSREFRDNSMRAPGQARAAGTGHVQDGAPSDGGFLLQGETSIDLMTKGFNNGAVTSRCAKRTITGSDSLSIVGIDETSRADGSRGGGIRVYTDAELAEYTSSMTKFNMIKIEPERLTGLCFVSDKLLKNATFLGQELNQLFGQEFTFKVQDLIMNGVGAGQALGILNAGCLVSITAETGQATDTIVAENVLKAYARFWTAGGGVWIANRNTFTQLYTMTYDIGTGGEMARLYVPPSTPGGTGSMLGYPVIFIEQAGGLGDLGDLTLCDLSQYICADLGNVDEASSIHLKFDYGQTTFRFTYDFDGQPRWSSALTPYKGTGDTVSPFVAIAAR
jgi:HK97 family phage major capsid protein